MCKKHTCMYTHIHIYIYTSTCIPKQCGYIPLQMETSVHLLEGVRVGIHMYLLVVVGLCLLVVVGIPWWRWGCISRGGGGVVSLNGGGGCISR